MYERNLFDFPEYRRMIPLTYLDYNVDTQKDLEKSLKLFMMSRPYTLLTIESIVRVFSRKNIPKQRRKLLSGK